MDNEDGARRGRKVEHKERFGLGVSSPAGNRQVLITGATYPPFGPVTGWQYGNGRTLKRTYDLDYRPTGVIDSDESLKLAFDYDPVGNLVDLGSGNQQSKLDYDALGRLMAFKDAATGTPIEQYTYDATGNRMSFSNAAGGVAYGYPADSHRLMSVGGELRTYDAMGNTTSIGGAAREFVYDDRGRMAQVKRNGVVAQNYAYNAKGEQVRRWLGAEQTVVLYDEAGHWIGEYDNLGMPTQQVIWMDNAPLGVLSNSSLEYIEPDHLGTPRLVIDSIRDVAVWRWDVIGEAFGASGPSHDPDGDGVPFSTALRFPGQRHDSAGEINYNYFRDFDPVTGRYIQSDPIGLEGGASSYAYVNGAPLISSDRRGLACDLRGCWNTPAELQYAMDGKWKSYYSLACSNGDDYACRGYEVATRTGSGLRGLLSEVTNSKLELNLAGNIQVGCPSADAAGLISARMEGIRRGLVKARANQLVGASPENPATVSAASIANFHHDVFVANGADPTAFGGDAWDQFGSFGRLFYDWCEAPACSR